MFEVAEYSTSVVKRLLLTEDVRVSSAFVPLKNYSSYLMGYDIRFLTPCTLHRLTTISNNHASYRVVKE
jgi:hypothetical protein